MRTSLVVVALALSGCDAAALATKLEPLPPVPGMLRLYGAALDGEAPLVMQSTTDFQDALWRWNGTEWKAIVELAGKRGSIGAPVSDRRGGAWLVVKRVALDGSETTQLLRVLDGAVTEAPTPPGLQLLGTRGDGSLLVSDGVGKTWRLPAGGTTWELFLEDADLAQWAGVMLDGDRLLNLRPSGLYEFDGAGVKRKAVPCGELLCARDSPGVGLVGGVPHMVFGSALVSEYVIMRVDLAAGTLTQVGKIDSRSPGGRATFIAQILNLAVTEKRWYAVRAESYGAGAAGWLIHSSIDGNGEPVLVTNKLTLGGSLLVSDAAIWVWEPKKRTVSRLAR